MKYWKNSKNLKRIKKKKKIVGDFSTNLVNSARKYFRNFENIFEIFCKCVWNVLRVQENFGLIVEKLVSFYPTTQQKSGNVFGRGVRSFVPSFVPSLIQLRIFNIF